MKPCDLSAVDAIQKMILRKLSPVELLESCLARIESVNGTINAITAMDIPRAFEEASVAEQKYARNDDLLPLLGLPVGIKDLNKTQGLRTTYGSLLHANYVPENDEALVARLRRAGAIILAKTNTPEFGSGSNTNNKVFGATCNPYDLARTPGGSSGGSAAALATGMLPLAHGSDTGGSLRNPATWSGVVGFRPTPGLVGRESRTLNYTHFSVQGPMARNVTDTSLMMVGLVGNEDRDALSSFVDASMFGNLDNVDISKLRVAWSTDFGGVAPIDDGIRRSFKGVIKQISSGFGRCEERHPKFENARDIFWVLRCVYYLANHSERVAQHRDTLSPNIVSNCEAGESMSLIDVARAERNWAELYSNFQDFFADIDLLIVPGNAVSPFLIAEGIPKSVGGKVMENYVDASLVRSALTLTGHPVIAIPTGLDEVGMPFGVQIVGKRRGDFNLLSAAKGIETMVSANPSFLVNRPDISKYIE
jgi:Asp-tRNA(Asn)/Glu-tRNA(Gln) amidotransferase A subunit family amidase